MTETYRTLNIRRRSIRTVTVNVRSQGAIAGASVMTVTPHERRLSRCALLAAL